MSGFFPVMMFGLPAACLAMYHSAAPERRKAVGGMLLSLALTSFLTGVTEPIEFTFMFLAPVLYAVHAVLTGLAMVLMDVLGVRLGFGFSAGLFDYVLNFNASTRPWLLLPIGAALFRDLLLSRSASASPASTCKTPGREVEAPAAQAEAPRVGTPGRRADRRARRRRQPARRRRLHHPAAPRAGRPGRDRRGAADAGSARAAWCARAAAPCRSCSGRSPTRSPARCARRWPRRLRRRNLRRRRCSRRWAGPANVEAVEPRSSRLRITVARAEGLDEDRLRGLGFRGVALASPTSIHLITGPDAAAWGDRLEALLAPVLAGLSLCAAL